MVLNCTLSPVTVVLVTRERLADHDAGPGHPERPARPAAARRGVHQFGLDEVIVVERSPAPVVAIERVHDPRLVASVEGGYHPGALAAARERRRRAEHR